MKLLRHTAFNLIGLGAPLLVAVGTIPVLIHELGPARFGLLTLIWAVVSYFGLFDLGLGRALTQQLAVVFANKEHQKVGPLVATATLLMAALGILAGVLMAAAASWGVGLIHDVPDRQEAINAVYAMALAMPFVVLTSGFRGILEARHAFGIVNLIRLPMGLFTFLGPLVVVLYGSPRLDHIAWVLATGRILAFAVHAYYAWRVLPKERSQLIWRADLLKPLCVSGGWLTVSNIISPFMGYVDRFLLAALVSAGAVAFYAMPLELVIKLSVFPAAITAVLFPSLAAMVTRPDAPVWPLCEKALLWLLVCMGLTAVPIALFSETLLTWWIGEAFSQQSALLLKIFCSGIAVNCLAHIPLTLLQSAGASRVTALIHCVELPLFLLVLWWLIQAMGVTGAALAWLLRMAVDTLLMFGASALRFESVRRHLFSRRFVSGTLALGVGFSAVLLESYWARGLAILIMLVMLASTLFPDRRAVHG